MINVVVAFWFEDNLKRSTLVLRCYLRKCVQDGVNRVVVEILIVLQGEHRFVLELGYRRKRLASFHEHVVIVRLY